MLSEKIALKKSLIEALTEQLRIEKTELKRLESKQSRLATFFDLQGSLLDDPDTCSELQKAEVKTAKRRFLKPH